MVEHNFAGGEKLIRKIWLKPKLIILTRDESAERVLQGCKGYSAHEVSPVYYYAGSCSKSPPPGWPAPCYVCNLVSIP